MNHIQGNVIEYLGSMPGKLLEQVYTFPASALVLVRLLPDFAKQIIYRLLYITEPIPITDIESWFKKKERQLERIQIIKLLVKLHILESRNNHVQLSQNFQSSLHNALIGGGKASSFGMACETEDKHEVTKQFLDQYAIKSWENVLHYLVGTSSDNRMPAVTQLLEKSGLMVKGQITSKGFQFLLQEMYVQVWALLLQYLELSESLQMEPVEVLCFLFQLGSLEFGQNYSVDVLTLTQKHMLNDLKYLGLVYQRNKKSSRFYPTRMATSLATCNDMEFAILDQNQDTDLPSSNNGYILIETNFRVYAYTSSPLQIAILSLFVEMQSRFANMVTGTITRDSIREALTRGISADQIIAYLTSHAHPEMRKSSPIIPSTVVDQIRLWEMERNRLRATKSMLYNNFEKDKEYRDICEYVAGLDYILWSSEKQRMLVLTLEGHEYVRTWLKSGKKDAS